MWKVKSGQVLTAGTALMALVAGTMAAANVTGSAQTAAMPTVVKVAVGLQKAADPGPFPRSVVPTTPTITFAGERDGESTFPVVKYPQVQPKKPGQMDFSHFHTGIEINWWLKKWAHENQDLVDLYVVGQSYSGTPIYQLTITDKSTGKDTDKPAAYFEGNRHSGETTSAESSLWLAWNLIENQDDDGIEKLLRDKAIYIRPVNNPDGHDLYLYTAQTNRSSVRPHDSDGDGKLDEDTLEDLNKDNFVSSMRQFVGAGKGTHIVDPRDPAKLAMQNVGAGKGDYLLFAEGIDNDKDGRVNEDGIGGLDLHRNYPVNWRVEASADKTGRGWTQGGAGEYPLSEPETRHAYTWLMSHVNIGVVNSMDTRVPMHLRPPSTCEQDECMKPEDVELYEKFDAKGVSFTGYDYAGNVYRDYATRFGGDPVPLFGHGPDFGYFGYGAMWYGDELWNGGQFKDYDGDKRYAEWELSRWCHEKGRNDCFIPWQKVSHPDLGEVEVGGINPKFWSQNPQPDLLRSWAVNQAKFNLWMTRQLPDVEVLSARAARIKGADDGATHEVTVRVRNTGSLPTALEMAKQVKIVKADTVAVKGAQVVGKAPQYWLDAKETKTVKVRVKQTGDAVVTVSSVSTRGGVDSTTVRLR